MTAPYRIAHVITNSQWFGGAQRNTLLTLTGLARRGFEVDLICGLGERLVEAGRSICSEVHVIPDLIRAINPVKDARVALHLWRLFRRRRYGIVHTHSMKAGALGRLAAWAARVPVIVHTVHGVPFQVGRSLASGVYKALERCLGLVTDRLVFVGEELRREHAAWKIAPSQKLVTVYSGIDFSAYVPSRPPESTKREMGLEAAWPIVGSIGRLSKQKAQEHLIEAAAILVKARPELRLLLVGEGHERPALEARIRDVGVESHVWLLGRRDDIPDLLSVFDIYAMSSRWEGVGRALTEAMYSALPIVATAVNGVREVIRHEETGLLVPPGDVQALAAGIDQLASGRELASRLGSAARRKAMELMDGEQMVTAIARLYEALFRERSPAGRQQGVREKSLGECETIGR